MRDPEEAVVFNSVEVPEVLSYKKRDEPLMYARRSAPLAGSHATGEPVCTGLVGETIARGAETSRNFKNPVSSEKAILVWSEFHTGFLSPLPSAPVINGFPVPPSGSTENSVVVLPDC